MTTWKYYDFDANLKEFYEIWQTDNIQEILKSDMDDWCQTQAYFVNGHERPTWNKGEPLWHLSRTDYHDSKMMDRANDKVEKEQIYKTYKKRMEQITGRKFDDVDVDDDDIFNRCFDEIMEGFKPKPHTIDSLILVHGKNYINNALYETAILLFPDDDDIIHINSEDDDAIILNLSKNIVFDLLNFYYSTRDQPIPIDEDFINELLNTFQH